MAEKRGNGRWTPVWFFGVIFEFTSITAQDGIKCPQKLTLFQNANRSDSMEGDSPGPIHSTPRYKLMCICDSVG
jgi:hypothetical protein